MNNVCVYFHINPAKQEIFYVGIGIKDRPYHNYHRNSYWKKYTQKHDYQVIVIHENLTWEEACKLEINYIAQIGREDKGLGTLVNLTDGGDGSLGRKSPIKGTKLSGETKNRMKEAKLGKNVIRPILQLDLNGKIIDEHINIKAAKKKTGIGHIGQAINGKFKIIGGFMWRSKETNSISTI
jgi:hypothetical protein